MSAFAETFPDGPIAQQAAAQLPWFHIVSMLTKIPDPAAREWYAIHAVSEGSKLKRSWDGCTKTADG